NIVVDLEAGTVSLGGGVKYGELAEILRDSGAALHNMASLPHISVAGAVAQATHGSRVGNGNLATAVAALEIATSDGELVRGGRPRERRGPVRWWHGRGGGACGGLAGP